MRAEAPTHGERTGGPPELSEPLLLHLGDWEGVLGRGTEPRLRTANLGAITGRSERLGRPLLPTGPSSPVVNSPPGPNKSSWMMGTVSMSLEPRTAHVWQWPKTV